jgi:integrase/recombinase XerC
MTTWSAPHTDRPVLSVPLDRLFVLLDDFLSRRSEHTRAAYDSDLKRFAAFVGVPSAPEALQALLSAGPGDANGMAIRFRNAMAAAGLSAVTVNRRLSTLRSVVALARTTGVISWELSVPGERAQPYRDTRGPGKPVISQILSALRITDTPKAKRDYAIVRLMLDLGLRRGEVARLSMEDIHLSDGTILVLGKGRTAKETLTLPRQTSQALQAWIETRGRTAGPLFLSFDRAKQAPGKPISGTSLYRLVRHLGRSAGTDTRPHALRHAAVTQALNVTGGDVRKVAAYSRHRDLCVVLRYDDARRDFAGEVAQQVAASYGSDG